MIKKVALYFGSFNPIHIGHKKLALSIVDNNFVDELWFVISPCNPLKDKGSLLDENIRLKMVELSIKNHNNLKICNIEFIMPIPSYTIDTLKKLSEMYTDIEFTLIIGSDNMFIFDKWKDYEEILNNYNILVYPRLGFDFNDLKYKYPQMKSINAPCFDISSTEIRENLLNNKEWLDDSVYKYIINNNLYK